MKMDNIRFAIRYLQFYLESINQFSIHSPFVFDLYTKAISDLTPFYIYDDIEKLRQQLLKSNEVITITDYGAGSKIFKSNNRKIGDIAKYALKSPKYSQLLFRLVNYFKPKTILELGTSLGITTLYLSTPNKKANVISLEGCPETAKIAQKHINQFNLKNTEIITGNFSKTLSLAFEKVKPIDFIFFDGNHQKEPTLHYFKQSLPYLTQNSFLIFDDIHWSDEMEAAWKEIINHPRVTLSIDLFQIGMVFFKEMPEKQNFALRF